ncbi:hypothetical protein ACFW2V_25790 [Streptomyces sp. NPDC058947]|uniref:hypothetical protein n=1 Tax=Streptomyces sp. NPDC058947 TaxID=3346675 RepID=UPI00369F4FF5
MTTVESPAATGNASALRHLYFVRFTFAVVWAVLLFATRSYLGLLAIGLLVLYPLFDLGAAVADARTSRATGAVLGLRANITISLLAAVGLAFAGTVGIPAVLRVWGAWAIATGLLQLIVGVGRRAMSGQWPMIFSGGLSVLAGAWFLLQATAQDPELTNVAGYALLGGLFFLISSLRLDRAVRAHE